jgi:hypothetical protein
MRGVSRSSGSASFRPSLVVGLLADDGMPTATAEAISDGLPRVLGTRLGDQVDWRVQVRTTSLSLNEHGEIPMGRLAAQHGRENGWDVTVLLTDLPRRAGTQPIVSDYSTARRVALLSVPALGAFALKRRTRDLVVHLVGHICAEELNLGPDMVERSTRRGLLGAVADRVAPTQHVSSEHDDIDQHLALRGARGRMRLLAGMVRDNRPWRLIPHLAGATAAAAATASYGVITSTFWKLATALSAWRLALINVMAILAMAGWLLVYNKLWDRPRAHQPREKAVLYNASTVLTLLIGVSCMYVILFVLALLAALVSIDSGYLASQLGQPATIGRYLTIAWLASSVGIVAGALGSSFESEDAVRRATYSRREQERQEQKESAYDQ